jgi:hypothetical protein
VLCCPRAGGYDDAAAQPAHDPHDLEGGPARLRRGGRGGLAYLSAADRFFRYHASSDRTATLGEELERLADLAAIDSGFSLDVAGPGDRGSLFIERLSLIDSALKLAAMPGQEGPVLVEVAAGEGEAACVLSRGGEKRLVRRAG